MSGQTTVEIISLRILVLAILQKLAQQDPELVKDILDMLPQRPEDGPVVGDVSEFNISIHLDLITKPIRKQLKDS